MKLWILRPVNGLPHGDDPWEPWYDKAFGFVVRASTEEAARALADADAGDENRGQYQNNTIVTFKPWLDAKYSTCEELQAEGEESVLMSDVHSA